MKDYEYILNKVSEEVKKNLELVEERLITGSVSSIDIYKYKAFMNFFSLQSIPTMIYYYNKKIWDALTITGADIGTDG